MTHIHIQNEQNYPIDADLLQRAIQQVIDRHEVAANSGVSVVLTTNEAVQALNKQHRQIDTPTDVLSFPADPLPPELANTDVPYLGDLIIAYPYASAQAKRLEHNLEQSLALLVVHGTLHLLGYDHDTPQNRAAMWAEQSVVLKTLNISDAIVPSLEESDYV